MSKWIILLTCALSLTACNSMSGRPTSSGATSGTSGMGGMGGSGAAPALPDTGSMPAYPSSTPSGTSSKPDTRGTPGSSDRPESSGGNTTMPGSSGGATTMPNEPMPSGSGTGGMYDGGSSNNGTSGTPR